MDKKKSALVWIFILLVLSIILNIYDLINVYNDVWDPVHFWGAIGCDIALIISVKQYLKMRKNSEK